MKDIFPGLTSEENIRIQDVIPLITLLIAEADGMVDRREAGWAEKVVKVRAYTHHEDLKKFYEAVSGSYEDRLNHYLRLLPNDKDEAQEYISGELAKLDPVIQRIKGEDRYLLYLDLKSFAKHVAKASGGIFGIATISPEEEPLLELNMLTPVENYPGI